MVSCLHFFIQEFEFFMSPIRATHPVHHAALHCVALSSLGGGGANYEAPRYAIFPATVFSPSWFKIFSLYSVLKLLKCLGVLRLRSDVVEDSVLTCAVGLYASRQHNILFLKNRNIQQ